MPITHSVYTYLSNKCINFLLMLNWLVGRTFLIGVCDVLGWWKEEREKMWSRATPQMWFDTEYLVIFLRPRLILRVSFFFCFFRWIDSNSCLPYVHGLCVEYNFVLIYVRFSNLTHVYIPIYLVSIYMYILCDFSGLVRNMGNFNS